MASLEYDIPNSPSTIFDVGSMSKQFVAVCVQLLVKKGQISLRDDIRKYIPELRKYGSVIRIDQLLHHASGIRDYLGLMDLAGMGFSDNYSVAEILDLISRQGRLNFRPGTEFLYSNSGYLLLGEVVRRVSGASLRNFAEKEIFSVLGMKSTRFHDNFSDIIRNKAQSYSPRGNGYMLEASLLDVVGDGGVNTTIEDLLLWDRNFYHNKLGEGALGLIEEISKPGKLEDGTRLEYAHGLFVTKYRGLKMVSHAGAWLGYRSELLRFPEKRFSVVVLSNLSTISPTRFAKDVADLCLAEWFEEDFCEKRKDDPVLAGVALDAEKAGVYISTKRDIVEITRKDGVWSLNISGAVLPLQSAGKGKFSAGKLFILNWPEMTGKKIPELILRREGMPAARYCRVQERVSGAISSSIAGDYLCRELGATYRLVTAGSGLKLQRKKAQEETLRPITSGLFKGSSFVLKFGGRKNARQNEFTLSSGRVKNLCFRKLR